MFIYTYIKLYNIYQHIPCRQLFKPILWFQLYDSDFFKEKQFLSNQIQNPTRNLMTKNQAEFLNKLCYVSSKYCTKQKNDKGQHARIQVWEKKIKKHAQKVSLQKI